MEVSQSRLDWVRNTLGDHELSAEQLDEKYNPNGDGEHPVFQRMYWRDAVAAENTISGYWDWVAHTITSIAPWVTPTTSEESKDGSARNQD